MIEMQYKVFKTEIGALDKMLGGGLMDDGILLIIYDTGSYGWALGVEIFRRFLERDWFGMITNYSMPYSLLKKYGLAVRFPLEEFGRAGRLAVVDVFGSVNGVKLNEPFVYYLGQLDSGTYLPKMLALYSKIIANRPRRIGLTVTVDGFVETFGEENAMRILKRNMALREGSERPGHEGVLNVFLINRDRVSRRFLSWISQYAEHILETRPTGRPGVEELTVLKSLLPDFEPSTGTFRFKKGRICIQSSGPG